MFCLLEHEDGHWPWLRVLLHPWLDRHGVRRHSCYPVLDRRMLHRPGTLCRQEREGTILTHVISFFYTYMTNLNTRINFIMFLATQRATDRTYGYSYIIGWIAMVLAAFTATSYSVAGCYIGGERYREKVS
jgi:hypothetical protein